MTFSDAERLVDGAEAALGTLEMTEEEFRAFHERTARLLWAYLSRVTGDAHAADDLLQEAYYRLLRSGSRFEGEAHRRHYLFRIATNLANDRHRRAAPPLEPLDERSVAAAPGAEEAVDRAERGRRLHAALGKLKPRERALLWLAYAEGSSHKEIAEVMGVRASGVRVMLFRARRKILGLLGRGAGRVEGGGGGD